MRESLSQCFMVQAGERFRLLAFPLTDENLDIWPHLTAKEARKYTLTPGGQEQEGNVDFAKQKSLSKS